MAELHTTIALPWPPPQLSPNFKRSHHWSAYRKHARNARTLAWGLTAEALGPKLRGFSTLGHLDVYIEATPPMRRGPLPDEDNFKGACKHYLDGIADALGLNDRAFRFAPDFF